MSDQQHQHHHHHGQHRDANLTAKYVKSDFLCRLNFNNKLPPIPCESKLLSLPFNPNDYDKYKLTTLELKRKFKPVIPKRTAVFARDFIDPATYTAPTTTTTTTTTTTNPPPTKKGKFLDIEDFELFEDTNPYKLEFDAYLAAKDAEAERLRRESAEEAKKEAKRKRQQAKSSSSSSSSTAAAGAGSGGDGGDKKRAKSSATSSVKITDIKPDSLENQRAIIERSFEAIKEARFVHPDNPNAKCTCVIPVFPSFELYGVDNIYVRSKANPLYDRETSAAEDRKAADADSLTARSVIRGVTDEGRRKGEEKHIIQVLYPDGAATREASESQKIEPNEEVYTYSGFFESEFVLEKRNLGLVVSVNAHKEDSVPGAEFVAEYFRLANTMQLQRANGVDMTGKKRYVRVGKRDMNQKEESEFERRQEALSKPDRGNLYEMEIPAGGNDEEEDEEDEEEEEEEEMEGNFEDEDVDVDVDEYGDPKEVPSPSSSSDSE